MQIFFKYYILHTIGGNSRYRGFGPVEDEGSGSTSFLTNFPLHFLTLWLDRIGTELAITLTCAKHVGHFHLIISIQETSMLNWWYISNKLFIVFMMKKVNCVYFDGKESVGFIDPVNHIYKSLVVYFLKVLGQNEL